MPHVTTAMSMSLDGFVAGPGNTPDNPLGDGGARLHEWVRPLASWRRMHGMSGGETGPADDIVAAYSADPGVVVMGRRMFDEGSRAWGAEPPFHGPVLVLTHRGGDPVERGATTVEFVTDGVHAALARARELAFDRPVHVAGGADVVQQFLTADLIDVFDLHLVPITLGSGTRLFAGLSDDLRLVPVSAVNDAGVTHLRYSAAR